MNRAIEILKEYNEYKELINEFGIEFINNKYPINLEKSAYDRITIAHLYIFDYIHKVKDNKIINVYSNFLVNNANNAIHQNMLGYCYDIGIGVEKNMEKAICLYKLSTKCNENGQCYSCAQNNLALCYDTGYGVEKNLAKSNELLMLSVEQNDMCAQRNLGLNYEMGLGVKQNWNEAIRLYKLSVDQGYADAQYKLGVCYHNGTGVEKNIEEAIKLYRLSANQGYSPAQIKLGICYSNGKGLKKNKAEALKLYILASKNIESALENIIHLEKRIIKRYEKNKLDMDELIEIDQITENVKFKYEIKKKVIEMKMFIMKLLVKRAIPFRPCSIITDYLFKN